MLTKCVANIRTTLYRYYLMVFDTFKSMRLLYAYIVNPKRLKRFKDKIRNKTKRGTGRSMVDIIKELNPLLRGWINYYRAANIKTIIRDIMKWIRRRLRMIQIRHWKTYKSMHKEMRKQGIKGSGEKMAMNEWKNSAVHIIHTLLPNKHFEDLGLIDLTKYEVGLLSNYY